MDGMQLPYFSRCFRSTVEDVVVTRPEVDTAEHGDEGPRAGDPDATEVRDPLHDTMPRGLRGKVRPARPADREAAEEAARRQAEDDDQMILIDFR